LRAQLHGHREQAKAAIFAAHSELLEDPDLIEIATSAIAKGKSAAFGWKNAVKSHAERLAGLRNQLLAQRANDLRDVGERVLGDSYRRQARSSLLSRQRRSHRRGPHALRYRCHKAREGHGLCYGAGRGDFARRHSRAFARHPGAGRYRSARSGTSQWHSCDPRRQQGHLAPQALSRGDEEAARGADLSRTTAEGGSGHALEPATTTDGRNIEVAGNIGGPKDAGEVAQLGGDGVGLLRSEFLFMERCAPPSEDEQFEEYKAIALALGADRP
jgi:multiphosphoryl transfer protein